MKNIILLTPLTGTGGIASWSRKFIKTFDYNDINIIPIDRTVKGRKFEEISLFRRIKYGLYELRKIERLVRLEIKKTKIDILHTTTSGSLGTYRDYKIASICKERKIKCIMHCRYGCITEDMQKGLYSHFLVKTMNLYDQIWVLDIRSANCLKKIENLKNKVFVVPNSIQVSNDLHITPKQYNKIAFVGNLVPTKGLFELINAAINVKYDIQLLIIGKGDNIITSKIKQIIKNDITNRIKLLGALSNEAALKVIENVDIVALPTYYPWEAFPMSILEAMSLGKLVISTSRGAISDMLTGLDGSSCGILVKEKSIKNIIDAIEWCINNNIEADELCKKAYEKVHNSYRMEVVYNTYIDLYMKVLK